ncbi:1-aminocyclopropane-1-carboxylate oxidase homolog 4-like [Ziziphus jujuba]|uniref:1-aminocyclopropane-1-carboxylate oxidase homolog 4-like n=1 Tax=Ziziphus jujuba TaxID=326968 RepID=A0ABM3ZXU0_ZIZJJ|nr:1-aminocyclopropane-1-carboxylate oxidase homolog 4-like [Ziziphus jujuba]
MFFRFSERQKKMMRMAIIPTNEDYDREKEIKQFDESKTGVKGLVDSGLTSIPRFFIQPAETLSDLKPPVPILSSTRPESNHPIPIIDLSGSNNYDRRSTIVDQIRRAAREFGFFQITNHGIPLETLDRTIAAIKGFHEQPTETKVRFYRREMGIDVSYISNVDLHRSKAASWRDTLTVILGPKVLEPEKLPEICRDEVVSWDREVVKVGELLMGLLSEGLGLSTGRLKEMTCLEGRVMVGQYYPHCPQPDLTVGLTSHTDPAILTVLMQDQTGGLQIKSGGAWIDVEPVPGALVINVGDFLQIISNDEYKSVEHRVLANSSREPRVSVVVFFNVSKREELLGPLPELVSPEKPTLFRQFTLSEFMGRYFSKELNGKTINYYRLCDTPVEGNCGDE